MVFRLVNVSLCVSYYLYNIDVLQLGDLTDLTPWELRNTSISTLLCLYY